MKEIFQEMGINPEFEIEKLEIAKNHVHIFLSFPSRYSITKVVGMLKSISASKGLRKTLKEERTMGW